MGNFWEDVWSVILGCFVIVILVVFVIGGAIIFAIPFQGESNAAFIVGGVVGLILGGLAIFWPEKDIRMIGVW